MDVIILGAGPSGIAAAINLHRNGLNISIFTRPKKSKGLTPSLVVESITHTTYDQLCLLTSSDAINQTLIGLYKHPSSTPPVPTRPDQNSYAGAAGYHISRLALDEQLFMFAKELGIKIIETDNLELSFSKDDSPIVRISDGRLFYASYLIDASGKSKLTGRKLKLNELFYSPPLTSWSAITDLHLHRVARINEGFYPTQSGWSWFALLSDGNCSWTNLSPTCLCDLHPPKELQHLPLLSHIRTSNVTWRKFEKIADRKYIIIGDAAGILDPATGHGIYKAINSGILAAESIVQIFSNHLSKTEILLQYNEAFSKSFENDARLLHFYYSQNGFNF